MRRYAAAVALLLAACSSEPPDPAPPPSAAGLPALPSPEACPTGYADPDPDRPRVALEFTLDAARSSVQGIEHVTFTPDLPITELVFRLWPNTAGAPAGTTLAVKSVSGAGKSFSVEPAGGKAGTPGTLLRVPLGRTAPAGAPVNATVAFTLTLGKASFDRWGSTGRTAWWGSGHPLLAWEHGTGWQRGSSGSTPGEYAVSEVARYDVTVWAPPGDRVLISGVVPTEQVDGRVHASNVLARDVSVAVGTFAERPGMVDGVPVTAAVSVDTTADPAFLLTESVRAVRELARLLGPYPYQALTVVALPSLSSGGIEYPGGFFTGPALNRRMISHEAAHQWFYGLVGDDQSRDPWLDESLASYAQALADGQPTPDQRALAHPGRVGAPMAEFEGKPREYVATVYGKGAAVLLAARADAGAREFDAALRCYVNAGAWRVAVPGDLERALAAVPAARARLAAAGAF